MFKVYSLVTPFPNTEVPGWGANPLAAGGTLVGLSAFAPMTATVGSV